MLWSYLARIWAGWREHLRFVKPDTVLAWQRTRFRDHWRRLSQAGRPGRPPTSKELRELTRRLSRANPTWSSPRIVGELAKLGRSTVERYRVRSTGLPPPTWKAFLENQLKDLVSIDLLTVHITVVLDNARYQCYALVQTRADELNIELLFLPAYSPNLDLIERLLWNFVKTQYLYPTP